MAYDYGTERQNVTDEMLLRCNVDAMRLLNLSGVATMDKLMGLVRGASTWTQIACVERLAELQFLSEVALEIQPATQNRIFRAGPLLPLDL